MECDHKFVNSTCCLKCGLEQPSSLDEALASGAIGQEEHSIGSELDRMPFPAGCQLVFVGVKDEILFLGDSAGKPGFDRGRLRPERVVSILKDALFVAKQQARGSRGKGH